MNRPYEYYRFRWWSDADLWKTSIELSKTFKIEWVFMPDINKENLSWSSRAKYNIKALFTYLFPSKQKLLVTDWLKVRADTLTAYLFPLKAMLFQRRYEPFTDRDLELRKKVLELYPYNKSSLISFAFVNEPPVPIAS